jgi:energy-coupling factor transporter ATP-binding protein EcfA2
VAFILRHLFFPLFVFPLSVFSKRCNIGLEVASAPMLLLLDEPTSGLDSTAAMEICRMLKDLARACQLTVVQVIHQPRVEIWDSLDEVLLLAPGGLTCYQGPQRLVVSYFRRTVAGLTLRPQDNPADALVDLIAEQGTLLVTLWKEGGREKLLQVKLDAKAAAAAASNEEREAHARSEGAKTLSSAVGAALSSEGASSPQAVLSPSAPVAEDDADHLVICPPSSSATFVRTSATTAAAVTFDPSVGGEGSARTLDGDPIAEKHITIDVQQSFPRPEQSLPPPTATVAADTEEDEISTIPLSPLAFMKNDPPKGTRGETLARYWTSFVGQPAFPPADVPLRQTASFLTQVWLSFARSLRKQSLNPVALLIEVTLGMLAGVVMGVSGSGTYQGVLVQPYTPLSPAPFESAVPQLGMLVSMAVGISAASAGARVFGGDEQIVYWREAAAGHGKLAYFIGNSVAQLPRNFLCGLHFALSYHILATPVMLFSDFLPVSVLLFYAVYGLGCLVSMLVARTNAALVSVVSALICAVFCGYVRDVPFVLKVLTPAYWATEAFFDKNTEPFQHIMQVAECSAPTWGYRLGWFGKDLALIFAVGTGYRVLAFVAMITQHRSKQK